MNENESLDLKNNKNNTKGIKVSLKFLISFSWWPRFNTLKLKDENKKKKRILSCGDLTCVLLFFSLIKSVCIFMCPLEWIFLNTHITIKYFTTS